LPQNPCNPVIDRPDTSPGTPSSTAVDRTKANDPILTTLRGDDERGAHAIPPPALGRHRPGKSHRLTRKEVALRVKPHLEQFLLDVGTVVLVGEILPFPLFVELAVSRRAGPGPERR